MYIYYYVLDVTNFLAMATINTVNFMKNMQTIEENRSTFLISIILITDRQIFAIYHDVQIHQTPYPSNLQEEAPYIYQIKTKVLLSTNIFYHQSKVGFSHRNCHSSLMSSTAETAWHDNPIPECLQPSFLSILNFLIDYKSL